MNIIKQKYYSFKELEARWDCTSDDLFRYVIDGELVPSIYMPGGAYLSNRFTPCNYEDADSSCLSSQRHGYKKGKGNTQTRELLKGFYYLILPIRSGTYDCNFSYFAATRLSHDEGDFCYSLEQPLGIDDVLRSGVVMADEVARVEAQNSAKPVPDSIDKPLSTSVRNTLLKLVIGMAVKGYGHDPEASKSTAPKEIADDLAGLGITITDDTVRKYLKQAADAVLPAMPRQL